MPSKKYLELQEFTDDDLLNELKETRAQYQKLQFDHAIKGLDNPLTLQEVRRDIARMKTEVRRRELVNIDSEGEDTRSKIRARRKKK